MKFGKTIQSQQVPGWGEYYLNYKALKKIINSYAAGRPASDASLLSLGQRPAKRAHSGDAPSPPQPPLGGPGGAGSAGPSSDNAAPNVASTAPPSVRLMASAPVPLTDLDPLPAESEPPAPSRQGSIGTAEGNRRSESFKAHRDVFFFTLQRELEKINAFYLLKERDLRLRLLTLLTNRKRLLSSQTRGFESGSEPGDEEVLGGGRRRGVEWASLEEGWRLFERDLGKLQGFIEINATGFRKILKKWDKRSKSNTKELYLERQVEVQPCFNREFIAKLSDIVAANLLDLENGSETLPAHLFADLPEAATAVATANAERRVDFDADAAHALAMDALLDLEANLDKALASGREALVDWLKVAKAKLRGREKRVMRILWRAALSVADEDLDVVLSTVQLDFENTDNINGRSPLHLACIAGSLRLVELCVRTVPHSLERADAYDRRPLHYAAMHGHAAVSSFLLDSAKAESSPTDMDGYTPLMHAISRGHLEVVQIFVDARIPVEPTKVSNDLIPLSLACQYGHVEVARLLLASGAKVLPNSEGLYPQHFAAKAGHEEICRLLVESSTDGGGGGKDRADKYNLWTPLHHAAVGGEPRHLACIKVLVGAGCDVNVPDEYGKSPGWYAAWFGHVECLNYLLDHGARLSGKQDTLEGMENLGLSADPQQAGLSPGSDVEIDQGMEEFELIPSLSLPPPIIPLRVYGHEFLAQRCLVQLSLGHPFSRPVGPGAKVPPVKLYSRSGQDPLHLWSSLKLVMTSKSDISAVPHSVILPLPDEREVFTFQVASLERFTLELSLYPTFGSKVIGRAIILPSTFLDIRYHKGFVAPLLDHHLKTIGEVAFEVSCIRPFQGAQLEIGGRVETYWKSKVAPAAPTQDHAHQYQAHRPLSVSSTPSVRPAPNTSSTSQAKDNTLVTASSLSGEYINVVVQVTKDGVPVVYPEWRLPVGGLDVGVPDVTYAQFAALAATTSRTFSPPADAAASAAEWYTAISTSMASLQDILAAVPPGEMGLNLQLRYSRGLSRSAMTSASTLSTSTGATADIGKSIEVNTYVDSVLHTVYDAAKLAAAKAEGAGRKMVFSSYDPTVCTALNWKQPNYAVFFASYCGISKESHGSQLVPAPVEEESDLRCLSVREAVNFAKSTNLLGVILEGSTLAAVPSLVASVKDAGLLLATCGDAAAIAVLKQGASDGRTVDAFVHDGIMTLTV